jgi:hypothetical protein
MAPGCVTGKVMRPDVGFGFDNLSGKIISTESPNQNFTEQIRSDFQS